MSTLNKIDKNGRPNILSNSANPSHDHMLSRLMAIRGILGVTRVADITGLDIVGIPVVQVARPFSLSNSVSQGKGRTLAAAAITAILESCESFFAERLDHFESIQASAISLGIHVHQFAWQLREDAEHNWQNQKIPWIAAENVLNCAHAMVPLELVHTAYVSPPSSDDGLFIPSTTGLAASFDEDYAILHGILECIERDAISRAHQSHGFFDRGRIEEATITDPSLQQLLEGLKGKGFLVGLWYAPSPTGVPVIWCHIMEEDNETIAALPHPAEGSAASLDPADAISRAILEAAQSRLSAISGARDDMTRATYPKYPDWEKLAAHRRLLVEGPQVRNFQSIGSEATTDCDLGLTSLLATIEKCGIEDLYKVTLDTSPINDLVAVKIIIPGLMPLLEG